MKTKQINCLDCNNPIEVSMYTHRGYCEQCKEKRYALRPDLRASDNYRHSSKGKNSKKKDESSTSGKERLYRYLATEKGYMRLLTRSRQYSAQRREKEGKKSYTNRYEHQKSVFEILDAYFGEKASCEHIFHDLVDTKTKNHLRIDGFYSQAVCTKLGLKTKGIVVEVHGAQHYIPVRFGSISIERATENLRTYQRRDLTKQRYCRDNNLSYCIVPYTVTDAQKIIGCVEDQIFVRGWLTVGKEFSIAYAHRLHNNDLSSEENKFVFGKCNNENHHGHNLKVLVEVDGFMDPLTGMLINFVELKRIVMGILDEIDHKNLNLDFNLDKEGPTTCERMLPWMWDALSIELPNLYKLQLWETDTSSVYKVREIGETKNG